MATSVNKLILKLSKFGSKTTREVDATEAFNKAGSYYQDLSGWDTAVVQVVTPSEAISFKTTNDDGAVTGALLPAPEVPVNWAALTGVNLATKADVTSVNASAIVEFGIVGKYLKLEGATTAAPYSYAYLLSKNNGSLTYAYDASVLQGTVVVYAATNTPASVTSLYYDSLLTSPVLGQNPDNWNGLKLATGTTVFAVSIAADGAVTVD